MVGFLGCHLFQLCRATKNYISNPRISILPQVFGPPWLAAGIVSDLRLGCDPIQIENWAPPSWSGWVQNRTECKIGEYLQPVLVEPPVASGG